MNYDEIIKSAEIIEVAGKLQHIKNRVYYFNEVTSTNELMLQAKEIESGSVFWAKKQTAGKGRQDRYWVSKEGGLWFTVGFDDTFLPKRELGKEGKDKKKLCFLDSCLRRNDKNDESNDWHQVVGINLVSALAVVRALEKLGIEGLGIKWPNDVWLAGKKICGILTQTSMHSFPSGSLGTRDCKCRSLGTSNICNNKRIALGIGLNVNQPAESFPEELLDKAASLKMITGKEFELQTVLESILVELDLVISNIFSENNIADFCSELNSKSILIDRKVKIKQGSEVFEGIVKGIADDGALLIEKIVAPRSQVEPGNDKHIEMTKLYAGEIIALQS